MYPNPVIVIICLEVLFVLRYIVLCCLNFHLLCSSESVRLGGGWRGHYY